MKTFNGGRPPLTDSFVADKEQVTAVIYLLVGKAVMVTQSCSLHSPPVPLGSKSATPYTSCVKKEGL